MPPRGTGRPSAGRHAGPDVGTYWSIDTDRLAAALGATPRGLGSEEAARRLAVHGPNAADVRPSVGALGLLARQFRSPLVLLLAFAAAASALTREWTDAALILVVLGATALVGFTRESRAQAAIGALAARVVPRARVLRDGREVSVPAREIVPGDVIVVSAGSVVPADAVLLEATDCFVNEAVLTGESHPSEKAVGTVPPGTGLAGRRNCLFLGTSVRTGTGRALVVRTGRATELGLVAQRLASRPPETEFERGMQRFGALLSTAMLTLTLSVFAIHVVLGRPPVETLLFAIALAVGLSPELLPAILRVNLSRAARSLAERGVLVRRLDAIENLGSMDVLCTDKTGTLTEGVVRLQGAYDPEGRESAEVAELGALNAALQAGLESPLDAAILEARPPDLSQVEKLGEVPYDFVRKRLSVVAGRPGSRRLVVKGAFASVLDACSRTPRGVLDADGRAALQARFDGWSREGTRVLAVATRVLDPAEAASRDAERDLTFEGFLAFVDAPKAGVAEVLRELGSLGLRVKIVTGDSELVARHVAGEVGLREARVMTGRDVGRLGDDALWRAADATDVFAEVDPNQKERIIRALRKAGRVVGFLGDGVNDAPAMHAADVSLSVDTAVQVARDAADFVLLDHDLEVIRRGILEGRRTFANTLKYVMTTMSANLGNMVSMAAASLFLPFLPMLAGQILLNNFLSDVPAIGLADDAVDPELVARPRRWDMRLLRRFMLQFGLLGSAFDLLTFWVVLGPFAASPELFRTCWFVESLLTELLIALVVRTRRPSWRSRPAPLLLLLTAAIVAVALAVPYLPFAGLLGFVAVPPAVMAALVGITLAYVAAAELVKVRFFARNA